MRALKALAEKNQDRATYDMTFTFTSDQEPDWIKTIHINRENWFDVQKFQVQKLVHFFIYLHTGIKK